MRLICAESTSKVLGVRGCYYWGLKSNPKRVLATKLRRIRPDPLCRVSRRGYGVVWWFGIGVGEVLSKFFRPVGGVEAILNVSLEFG